MKRLWIGCFILLCSLPAVVRPANAQAPARPAPVLPVTKAHAVSIQITADMASALDRLIAAQRNPSTGQPFASTDDLFRTMVEQSVSLRLVRTAPNAKILAAQAALKAAQEQLRAKQSSPDIKAAQDETRKAQADLAAAEAAAVSPTPHLKVSQ